MNRHKLSVNKLEFTYPDGTKALEDISLSVKPGESVGIIGENGAGKSTLILHFNGSLLPAPDRLKIGDIPVTKKNLAIIRKTVGLVFQDPDDQLFMGTVNEDIAFGPLNLGLCEDEVKQKTEKALEEVGLADLGNRHPYHLSGGEKKRVAIACVLALEPDILVLDEPSANLDPKCRRKLILLLQHLQHTKIIVSHDLDLVMDICKRTIVMHKGKIISDDSTVNTFKNEKLLEKAGLEQPLRLQTCPICSAPKR